MTPTLKTGLRFLATSCGLLILGMVFVHPINYSPESLRRTVQTLAGDIGERNGHHPEALERAAAWVEAELAATGLPVRRLPVVVPDGAPFHCGARTLWNLDAVKPGTTRASEVIVIGAHYDSKVATPGWHDHGPPQPQRPGTPGANDNASGVAAVLALARAFAGTPTARTLRFAAFVNEEPPYYQTDAMGSLRRWPPWWTGCATC